MACRSVSQGGDIMALKPIKVSQLNKYIGRVMQTDPILGNVSVTGEISNLKYHSSGHVYFTLKDDSSKVNCFMPAGAARSMRFQLADGMEVVTAGYISVYEKGGYYSLNIRDVQVSGEGGLALAYKAMYERLLKEGLFDASHKKQLPLFPRKVCVITSPTGAAVRDVIKIIKSRNDTVDVLVYPCLVQGDGAAEQIASAIYDVNARFKDIDVIITGRGGGSLEELWAFNEETVARSIYASDIPVISAVGHETDFSISDYAADARAETPTAAAAMAVPDTFRLRDELDSIIEAMSSRVERMTAMRSESLKRYSPDMLSLMFSKRITDVSHAMQRIAENMKNEMNVRIKTAAASVERFGVMLEAGDPQRIINRGYAVVRDARTGDIISGADRLAAGTGITLQMRGGEASAEITGVTGYGSKKENGKN